MTNFDAELLALHEKRLRKAKVSSMLSNLKDQMVELAAEEQRLDKVRIKEQADVDRLEKPSLVSFFYAVVNQKEEKLDREKAEAYAVAVKHAVAARQVEAIGDEIRALQAELFSLSGIETQYETVFAQKTAAVKELNPERAAEILHIEEQLSDSFAQMKEIDESVSVGQLVLSHISVVEGELERAEGWGTWDLLGGGLISDLAKHSHLDQAQAIINELQVTLRRYRTELADVKIQVDIQAQVEGFLRFADYFFDGLFADWAVLDSIHSAKEQIFTTRTQVGNVQSQLEAMKRNLDAEVDRLKFQLSDIVLKA